MRCMTIRSLLLALVLAVGAVGCGKTGRYNIRVTIAPELRDVSEEVHIVGVNDTDLARWNDRSMTQYWLNVGPEQDDVYRMVFGRGFASTNILSAEDEIWSRWKSLGARHLFILSLYPMGAKDDTGSADPRRLYLPMEKKRWKISPFKVRDEIVIEVRPAPEGLKCLTPPNPE